jgi:hypothetical protein
MLKKTFILTLATLVISSCNTTDTKTMTAQYTTENKTVQDSTSGYASVNGLKMYYEIYGQGKVLVLVHGGGSTIQTNFEKIIPLLSKNRKVIAVELQAPVRRSVSLRRI